MLIRIRYFKIIFENMCHIIVGTNYQAMKYHSHLAGRYIVKYFSSDKIRVQKRRSVKGGCISLVGWDIGGGIFESTYTPNEKSFLSIKRFCVNYYFPIY